MNLGVSDIIPSHEGILHITFSMTRHSRYNCQSAARAINIKGRYGVRVCSGTVQHVKGKTGTWKTALSSWCADTLRCIYCRARRHS